MPRKPPIGRRFQPGQSGNPKGGAAHNADMKRLRILTKGEVAEIGTMILEGNREALQAIAQDNSASALKIWFASVAVKAINKGDMHALDIMLNRIIGKVKEEIDFTNKSEVEHLTDAQILARISQQAKELKKRSADAD